MATVIRLRRCGAKQQPHYRVVATDSSAPRDGKYIENLGYYSPMQKKQNENNNFLLKLDRIDYWLSVGAKPSNTVNSLIKKQRKSKQTVKVAPSSKK